MQGPVFALVRVQENGFEKVLLKYVFAKHVFATSLYMDRVAVHTRAHTHTHLVPTHEAFSGD